MAINNYPPMAAPSGRPSPPACASVVELTISCRNLPNMDVLSKSDPMCVVYLQQAGSQAWKEIGRTEIIWDNLNPEFSKKIKMTYLFEQRQMLRFEIYDIDSESNNLEHHDFIGMLDASLGEIVSQSGLTIFERNLLNPRRRKNCGSIRVLAEEVSSYKEECSIVLAADHLPTGVLRTRRFFFEIHKSTEHIGYTLVCRSPNTLKANKYKSLQWPSFAVNLNTLCNGDLDSSIKISLRKYKWTGKHKLLGEWNTTVRTLEENKSMIPPASFRLESGAVFRLISFQRVSHASFLDYIKSGVEMNCFLAIDFTASNGNPAQPTSLHHIHPTVPNDYQLALRSVLEIIQDYDSDKMFPVLGFGALVPPAYQVSHEFFVNFHPSNPFCEGINGVMSAYSSALPKITLHGPTNFAPIINHVTRFASSNTDGSNYFILLIITDGIISDLPQTVNAIVAASSLPMSIIIVGVGNADFSAMEVLDADTKPLVDSWGRRMERDIVQFVPFNEIIAKASNNLALAKIDLAREVLEEIPGQFMSYMKKIGASASKSMVACSSRMSHELNPPPNYSSSAKQQIKD